MGASKNNPESVTVTRGMVLLILGLLYQVLNAVFWGWWSWTSLGFFAPFLFLLSVTFTGLGVVSIWKYEDPSDRARERSRRLVLSGMTMLVVGVVALLAAISLIPQQFSWNFAENAPDPGTLPISFQDLILPITIMGLFLASAGTVIIKYAKTLNIN